MPQRNVPGVGLVDFPDNMTEDQIQAAMQQHAQGPGLFDSARHFVERHDSLVPLAGMVAGFPFGGPVGSAAGAAIGSGLVHGTRAADPSYPTEPIMGTLGDIGENALLGLFGGSLAQGARMAAPRVIGAAESMLPSKYRFLSRLLAGGGEAEAPAAATAATSEIRPEVLDLDRQVRPGQLSQAERDARGAAWDAGGRVPFSQRGGGIPNPLQSVETPTPRHLPGSRYSALPQPTNVVENARQSLHGDDLKMLQEMLDTGYDRGTAMRISGAPEDMAAGMQPTPGPPSNLIKGSPTQPDLDWTEYANTTQPRRVSSKGGTFSMSTTPEEAIKGLKGGYAPPDTALDLSGRGPKGQPPKRSPFTPRTVDDAEGLSLDQQAQWERFKQDNPGTTDAMLNSWLTNQGNMEPNVGLDLKGMIDKLTSLIRRPR